MTYSMFGPDFVARFEPDGIRDEYYQRVHQRVYPVPSEKVRENVNGKWIVKESYDLGVLRIERDSCGRVVVWLGYGSEEKSGNIIKTISISDALLKVRGMLRIKGCPVRKTTDNIKGGEEPK
jgi:hypothetical protein